MSTKDSPVAKLRAEAQRMAAVLKKAERGEMDHEPKIGLARKTQTFKPTLFMDDKIIQFEFTWVTIRDSSEHALTELIVKHMREQQNNA